MDIEEFGKRITLIREEILKASQSELAEKLKISQVLLSRLERGVGGNITTIFEIISYLDSLGMQGHVLFSKNFTLGMLTAKTFSPAPETAKDLIRAIHEMKQRNNANNVDLDNIILSLSTM